MHSTTYKPSLSNTVKQMIVKSTLNVFVTGLYLCLAFQPDPHLSNLEVLTEKLSNILATCEDDRMHNLGILTDSENRGRWSSDFTKNASLLQIRATILDDNEVSFPLESFNRQFLHKLHVFVMIVSSPLNLKSFLRQLKKSMIWNPFALFLLIDGENMDDNCKNALDFLHVMWKMNLIHATFFCVGEEDLLLYTYNPYARDAPSFWQEVSTHVDGTSNHTWTLFKQTFFPGSTACAHLTYDKTRKLDGLEIKAVALSIPPTLWVHPNETDVNRLRGTDASILQALWRKLKVTPKLVVALNDHENYGHIERNGILRGAMSEVMSGAYDILLNAQYIFNKRTTWLTYPHVYSGISILTRRQGYETEESKILNFMNPRLMLGILFTFVITVLILRVFAGQELVSAALEVSRLLISSAMLRFPRRNSLRIYLITVILLFMLTSSLFQSNLSSILTSPIPKANVDTIDALKKSGYTIYAYHDYTNVIRDTELLSRLRTIDRWNCTEFVLKLEDAACAADRARLMKIAFDHNLHLSKHRVSVLYSGYLVRPDWPLIKRVSTLLLWMTEAGLVEHWTEETLSYYTHKWEMRERNMKAKRFRRMKVRNLAFAFQILGFGVTLSCAVFVVEIAFGTWRKHRVKRVGKMEPAPLFPFVH